FAIANCSFTGNSSGGNVGVLVFVADNTELDGGSIQNCTISNVAQGIWIETGLLATVSRDFTVTRNTISNFLAAGVQLRANIGDSTNSTTVRGNTVVGDGIGATNEVGLDVLITNALGAVSPSVVDGLVAFNDFSLANTNIMLRTTGADVGSTRVESVFAGNVIRNAVEYGVRFASFIDDGGMAPDFGGKVGGGANSGRNTFENPTATWEVGLDDIFTVPIAMAENFWIDGVNPASRTEISGGNFPSFLPVISNNLVGSLSSGVIQAEQADVLTISLSSGRFVVQVNEAFVPDVLASIGEFGQYKAFGISGPDGNVSVEPIDLQLVAVDGTELSFNVPGLTAGNYTITFTNPGFQSLASLGLRVTNSEGSGGDGGGGGCVVATAAHGDYNAPEVRILRKFRDRYLLPYAGGRSAVRAYYKHGGPAAVWIAERDWAKSAMRATLAVPTGVAWSLLYWNPGQRLLIAVLLLGGSFAMLRRRS
ncbi:MAG: right-handed parallel beta-helix repeat-containing protein, partial [Planctomycetes bacterium]|nr:right-handed parallel beta-helix repeat-containing protein [Planctomycetota bacterium]